MLQKIREAMIRRDSQYMLDGLIEIDDAFIGGPGGKRWQGNEKGKGCCKSLYHRRRKTSICPGRIKAGLKT